MALAERAEDLGYDSIWAGDSILARPRHGPLTLLSAVAARVRSARIVSAVPTPALQPGRPGARDRDLGPRGQRRALHPGVGIAGDVPNIPPSSFFLRAVRSASGACSKGCASSRELWTGKPVTWNGRWVIDDATLGPVPHRPGGPPIWIGGMVRASLERVGRLYDGWFPIRPIPKSGAQWAEIHTIAQDAGRDPAA